MRQAIARDDTLADAQEAEDEGSWSPTSLSPLTSSPLSTPPDTPPLDSTGETVDSMTSSLAEAVPPLSLGPAALSSPFDTLITRPIRESQREGSKRRRSKKRKAEKEAQGPFTRRQKPSFVSKFSEPGAIKVDYNAINYKVTKGAYKAKPMRRLSATPWTNEDLREQGFSFLEWDGW